MPESEAAHILFPNDAPSASGVPDWFKVQVSAAEARLSGTHEKSDNEPAQPENGKADEPVDANKLFPSEARGFDEKIVSGFTESYLLDAVSDGDQERAEELRTATSALTEDFRKAGTDGEELKAAFGIIRECNDQMVPLTDEQIAMSMNENLTTLQTEFGTSFEGDLGAARAFIRDLDLVAPGTMASLERNGSGNDLRLVRAAIKEARRRGY